MIYSVLTLVRLYFLRYAPRYDCASEYDICVELLNKKKKPIHTFAPEPVFFEQWNEQKWSQVRPTL